MKTIGTLLFVLGFGLFASESLTAILIAGFMLISGIAVMGMSVKYDNQNNN